MENSFSPQIYLLHDFSLILLDGPKQLLMLNLCVAASLLLATNWGSAEGPLKEEWLGKARFLSLINQLSALTKYCQGNSSALLQFLKVWVHFFG